MKSGHGGDLESYYEEFGRKDVLDFSANISPLGMSEGIRQCLLEQVDSVEHYPDPYCRRLTKALGEEMHLPISYFLCGNGASDLIYRFSFAVKPKKALLLAPTFSEYQESLSCVSCEISYHYLKKEEQFQLNDSVLDSLTEDIDVFFLCQPNNPTGVITDGKLLQKILQKTKECGIYLVVDQCFLDFSPNYGEHSLTTLVGQWEHLLILQAFTKMYGVPGLRLGYAISSNEILLEDMRRCGPPWAVSTLAEEVGIVAVKEKEYVKKVRHLVGKQRAFLEKSLKEMGFWVSSSQANFILFESTILNLEEPMKKQGILIRDCSNYIGLNRGFYRIAVRSQEENEMFITALKKCLE